MKSEIIEKIKLTIDENKENRKIQIKFFVPLAREVIEYVMTSGITGRRDIEQFFRIFNFSADYDTMRKAINKINAPKKKIWEWLKQVDLIESKETKGFTRSARSEVSTRKEDIDNLKKVFTRIIKIPEDYKEIPLFQEEVKKLYNIPYFKRELSVWLNYLKPTIFPIISGSGEQLFYALGYDTSWNNYHKLLLDVPKISMAMGQKDFGIIDSASWELEEITTKEGSENNKLIILIKKYEEFRKTDKWEEMEKYKWDYLEKHKEIFSNLENLYDKILELGSPNIAPFVWKNSMFRRLAKIPVFKEILRDLFNENEEIETRIDLFIERIKETLEKDPEWKNKEWTDPGKESASFFLFLKDPKKYLLYTRMGPYNKFAKEFKLTEVIDATTPSKEYNAWQNYCNKTLIPLMEETLNRKVDLLDCQDFIYCLSEHLKLLDGSKKEEVILNDKKIFSKNLILYGPPGTGKTFITKRKAVEIIAGLENG